MKAGEGTHVEEAKVVNQLLAALNMLYVLPNEEELGRFTAQALKNVPGIDYCSICIRGQSQVIGDFSTEAEHVLNAMSDIPEEEDTLHITFPANTNLMKYNFQSSKRAYGYLFLSAKSNSDFSTVKPAVSNFINVVSIDLERRWQKSQLEKHRDQLEQQVEKRTADLTGEIDVRKHTEKELLKNQYYLTKAQEIGSIGTWELDIPQDKLIWTAENYKIFGVPQGTEMNLELFLNCIHPEDRDYVIEKWTAALNHEPYDIEHRLLVQGKVKWVREKADIDFDADGKPILAIGFTQDITKGKEAQESVYRYSKLMQETVNEVYIFDAESYKFIEINKSARKNLGYTIQELLQLTPVDIKPEHNIQSFEKLLKPLKDNKVPEVQFYTNHQRKDGSLYPVEVHVQLYSYGQKQYFSAFILDITDRKKIEKDLIESESRFRGLIEQAGDAMYLSDFDGNIIEVNNHSCNTLGYTREELLSMQIGEIDTNYTEVNNQRNLWDKLVPGIPHTFETYHKRKNGDVFPVEVRFGVFEIEGNKSILCFVRDITERKLAEDELTNHRNHLEEMVKERTAQLEEKNKELERFNNLFVGRELRIIDLKDELKELKKQL